MGNKLSEGGHVLTFTAILTSDNLRDNCSCAVEAADLDQAAAKAIAEVPEGFFVAAILQTDRFEAVTGYLVQLVMDDADEIRPLPRASERELTWYDHAEPRHRLRALLYRSGELLEVERESPSDSWPVPTPVAGPQAVPAGARRIAIHRGLRWEVNELTGEVQGLASPSSLNTSA